IVHPRTEHEASALIRPIDRPSSEATRNLLHILLRIAAADSKRVKFHQLACVVFIDAGLAPSWGLGFGGWKLGILSTVLLRNHRGVWVGARRRHHGFGWRGIGSRSRFRGLCVLQSCWP